ncbi:MAG TPA: CheR family methyltransferase [Terriglobales bacterium]|nr:CheR family methyltransferase [Terriglobales bacterium]
MFEKGYRVSISEANFQYIRDLVYQMSGNLLGDDKGYLVETRLEPLVRTQGFGSLQDLVTRMRKHPGNGLHWSVVEAMINSETSFFRDVTPFEMLKKWIIPNLLVCRAGERRLNIWCAAAASGQEPYSILMVLYEEFPTLHRWEINLHATDISKKMLARCIEGCYSQTEINRGLPAAFAVKYFEKKGIEWCVKDLLRRPLKFRQMNLVEPWPPLPRMDLIFLRNVLIYLSVETRRTLLGRIRKVLAPDGYLFLGSAETTLNLDDEFERVQVGRGVCYRLRGQ